MQLEVGKYYRTRDGRKVGPMEESNSGDTGGFYCDGFGLYRKDGRFGYGANCFCDAFDTIAEWTDEPPQNTQPIPSSHTIDHIAIDSLRHHYATEMEPLQKEAFRIVLRYYGVTA